MGRQQRVVAAMLVALGLAACPARGDDQHDSAVIRTRLLDDLRAELTGAEAAAIPGYLKHQRPDGSFDDLDYASTLRNDSWQPQMHLKRLRTMGRAYVGRGQPFGGDAQVRAAVMRGVGYWLDHDFKNSNWFWNEIGVPADIADLGLMFWTDFTPAQRAKAMEILGRAKAGRGSTNVVWYAKIIYRRGLLADDPAVVRQGFDLIADQLHVMPVQADGPQPDGSFVFHGSLLYSFGYGLSFLRDNAANALLVAGTSYAVPSGKMALVRDWTLDGAQWFTRGTGADPGANGRGIVRKGYDARSLAPIGRDLMRAGVGRDAELAAMIARSSGKPGAPALVGNRMFWRADMMIQQRPAYYASARMFSTRTRNTEWGNGENAEAFHMADGCNLLMRAGDEYTNIYPVWDWQRIPGTTVELIPNWGPVKGREGDPANDAFVPNRKGIEHKTTERYVGGASDGQCGAFGGRFSYGHLRADKGWFFFDDAYACLGSNIQCDDGNAVVTTLDQTYLRGPVVASDGEGSPRTLMPGTTHDEPAVRWVLHDGVGYLFDRPTHVQLSNGKQVGSWGKVSSAYPMDPVSADVFKAWVDHGPNPVDATYAYTVLPTTDAGQLAAAVRTPPIAIVANSAAMQAVWHARQRRGAAILYDPGSVPFRQGLSVSVDKPVVLMVAESDDGVTVSAANPLNAPLAVHVRVERDGKPVDSDLQLPGGDRAGSTVAQRLTFGR